MTKSIIIDSYGVILLIHLIKQKAEKRSTCSWDVSIENTVHEINKINKRRKSSGFYLNPAELIDILQQGYQVALKRAALEAFVRAAFRRKGRYEAQELAAMVDQQETFSRSAETASTIADQFVASPFQSIANFFAIVVGGE